MRDLEYKPNALKMKWTENTGNTCHMSVCKGNEHLKKILNDPGPYNEVTHKYDEGTRVKKHKEPCIQLSVSNGYSAGGHGSGSIHIPLEDLEEFVKWLHTMEMKIVHGNDY